MKKHTNIEIGMRIGCFTILDESEPYIGKSGKKYKKWLCRCDCGNIKSIADSNLKTGRSKSCGECKKEVNDLTGEQFGLLKVLEQGEDYIGTKGIERTWICECQCEQKTIRSYREYKLLHGYAKSCGCRSKLTQFKKQPNTYDLTGEYGIGYTLNNKKFYFDLEDYDKIKNYTWTLGKDGYLISNTFEEYQLMHRLIMNPSKEYDIDHINHKKYDNRKCNLRITTTQQNCSNRKITNKNGINGVYHIKGKWVAKIGFNNQFITLGTFNTKEEAISARKAAEEKYYGEYSYLNSICKEK